MPRAVTPTARARSGAGEEEVEEVEEEDDDDDDDGDDDDEEESPSAMVVRSRSVTSHQGPTVLTRRSMPRSTASRCTSAKVSSGAGAEEGGAGEEEEEEGAASSTPLTADDLLRMRRRLGKGFIRGAAGSGRGARSGADRSAWREDGGASCLMAPFGKEELRVFFFHFFLFQNVFSLCLSLSGPSL